jgi:hypothetical protein
MKGIDASGGGSGWEIRRATGYAQVDATGAVLLVPASGQSIKTILPDLGGLNPDSSEAPVILLKRGAYGREPLIHLESGPNNSDTVLFGFKNLLDPTKWTWYYNDGGDYFQSRGTTFCNVAAEDGTLKLASELAYMVGMWADVRINLLLRNGPPSADEWMIAAKDYGISESPVGPSTGKFHFGLSGTRVFWWSSNTAGVDDPNDLDLYRGRSERVGNPVEETNMPTVYKPPVSLPVFGVLEAGDFTFYLDPTAGAPKIKFLARDENGDPFSAEIDMDPVVPDITSIPGLICWLKDDTGFEATAGGGGGIPTIGNPVGRWSDSSGFGNHWDAPTSGARPVRATLGVTGDGVDDTLMSPATLLPAANIGDDGWTLLFRFKRTSTLVNGGGMISFQQTNDSRFGGFGTNMGGGARKTAYFDTLPGVVDVAAADTATHVVGLKTGADGLIYVIKSDGSATSTGVGSWNAMTTLGVSMLSHNNVGAYSPDTVEEVAVFNRELSGSELSDALGFLA